jgi:hypothetical protein
MVCLAIKCCLQKSGSDGFTSGSPEVLCALLPAALPSASLVAVWGDAGRVHGWLLDDSWAGWACMQASRMFDFDCTSD